MKQLKRHCLMMLLLATLWMTAACGRDNGATNDSNDNANSGAGMEEAGEAEIGNGNESIDGRPFDEIIFDTDGDGIYDHTDVDGDGLLEEIGRDADDMVDDLVNGVTEAGDTLMDGSDDVENSSGTDKNMTDTE